MRNIRKTICLSLWLAVSSMLTGQSIKSDSETQNRRHWRFLRFTFRILRAAQSGTQRSLV